jgi:predicted metal-dependent phosphoesterase TrpH
VITLDQLAQRVAEERLDVVCVTDHNVTSAALLAAERGIGARHRGEEIRTPSGDLIGLFLAERIPYVLPAREVAERIRGQGGLVYVPHPFDTARANQPEGQAGSPTRIRPGGPTRRGPSAPGPNCRVATSPACSLAGS